MSGCDTELPIPTPYNPPTEIENRVKLLEALFNEIAKEVTRMRETFSRIAELTDNADKAQMIFAQKVHDLKYIDKKRDDVINALCQKVENSNGRLNALADLLGAKISY